MRKLLCLVLAVIVTAGCALGEILADYGEPVDMRPSDLVGTWRSGPQRTMTFHENGTFTANDLPYEYFDPFLPVEFDATLPVDGAGTWRLEPPLENPEGPRSSVELSIELTAKPGRIGVEMSALRQDDDRIFLYFFYVGSGGNSWTSYERCGSDCPAARSPSARPS